MKYFVRIGGREIEVEVDGHDIVVAGRRVTATLATVAGTPLRSLLLDGRSFSLPLEAEGRGRWVVTLYGERTEAEVIDERTRHIRSLTGADERPSRSGTLRAPMPGLVVRVQVEPGQRVSAGTPVVVLEAMKMENQLKAPVAGMVRAVFVAAGEAVEKGKPLLEFGPEPAGA